MTTILQNTQSITKRKQILFSALSRVVQCLVWIGCLQLAATPVCGQPNIDEMQMGTKPNITEIQMYVGGQKLISRDQFGVGEALHVQSSDPSIVDVNVYYTMIKLKAKEVGKVHIDISNIKNDKKLLLEVVVLPDMEIKEIPDMEIKEIPDIEIKEEYLTIYEGYRGYISFKYEGHLQTEISVPEIITFDREEQTSPLLFTALKPGKTVLTLSSRLSPKAARKRIHIQVLDAQSSVEAVILDYWIQKDLKLKNLIEEKSVCVYVFTNDHMGTIGFMSHFTLGSKLRETFNSVYDPILIEMLQKKGFTMADAENAVGMYLVDRSTDLLWRKLLGCAE